MGKTDETGKALENHVSGQSNKPLSKPAHALSHEEVTTEIKANSRDGLTSAEAKSRLEEYGKNDIGDGGGVQPLKILLRQVANAMTLVCLPSYFYEYHVHTVSCSAT